MDASNGGAAAAEARTPYGKSIAWSGKPWREITQLPEITADQERLAAVLADARVLLWNARVRREGDTFRWAPVFWDY